MPQLQLAFVLGTRPEIIKMSPVIRAAQTAGLSFMLIHTNQHYSERMDKVFFDELELPQPTHNLGIGSGSHGEQTGRMMIALEPILQNEQPDVVLVQGDTNTVLAGALVAQKLGIRVGHIEAGLRSFDRSMPEETNRIVTDHVSDYLFAPTTGAAELLRTEGLPNDRIFVTGNTVVDGVKQNSLLARRKSTVLADLGLAGHDYDLLTLHRPANVDHREILSEIFRGLAAVAAASTKPIIFPIHPRTRKQLSDFQLHLPAGIRLIEPVGYLDFLLLEEQADLILTDSGGIQEEACIVGVPCVTIRENTERPETVTVGANELAGRTADGIMSAATTMRTKPRTWSNPFGDGTASEQIIRIVSERI